MSIREAFRSFFSVTLLLSAIWFAYPNRNLYGNPSMEELHQSCTTAGGTTARLYVGNGGATTAFWYTVTTKNGFFSPEKQVLFSYGSPELLGVTCAKEAVLVSAPNGGFSLTEPELTALRNSPRAYWQGDNTKNRGWSSWEILHLAVSLTLAWAGLFLLRPIYRRIKLREAHDEV